MRAPTKTSWTFWPARLLTTSSKPPDLRTTPTDDMWDYCTNEDVDDDWEDEEDDYEEEEDYDEDEEDY